MLKVLVTLSPRELEEAAYAGVNRRIRALRRKRRPRQNGIADWEQHWWQSNIIGAIGEAAVSKAFGVAFVDLADDPNGKDVLDYQVRTTERPDGKLLWRTTDDPSDSFILVEVRRHYALLHGYSTGSYIRDFGTPKFENTFVLDRAELWPVTDLAHPIEWSDTVAPYELFG